MWSGLTLPTAIAFAPGGKVFVGEKSGILKVFDSLTDPTPTQAVHLRTQVQDFWDRGLLALAVDPGSAPPAAISSTRYTPTTTTRAATRRSPGDGCPTPPGPTTDGCVVTGNLSRIPVNPPRRGRRRSSSPIADNGASSITSHSIGHLAFGPDGYLYVTGGDGASYNNADWGQFGGSAGSPTPGRTRAATRRAPVAPPLTAARRRGRRAALAEPAPPAGEPILLNGAMLRVDPATGTACPATPCTTRGAASNASRIIGYGLRNPFRFTFRPGTSEIWVGDVGWTTWEEINRMTSPTPTNALELRLALLRGRRAHVQLRRGQR